MFISSLLALSLAAPAGAAQPAALAAALQNLRDQRSYSWEIINGDPGPVALTQKTRRGTVTAVQQNTSPHVKGTLALNGEALVHRDWPDGLTMTSFIATDGTVVTQTPEGWLTAQEILDAIAEERTRNAGVTERLVWLRRADRPDLRRPDEELAPFIKGAGITEAAGDTYTLRARVRADGWIITDNDETQPAYDVTFTLNLRSGVLRDYEFQISGTRRAGGRAGIQLPVNDDRIVILTYVPVARLDVPAEARAKLLKSPRPPGARRN